VDKEKVLPDLRLKVCKKQCDQCLFTRNRIVTLSRKKQILKDCIEEDKHFECHKGTVIGIPIVCRGFYNQMTSNIIRIAERMNWITFVDPFELMLEKKKSARYFDKDGFNTD
jgi:hypothetical protein